MHLVVTGTSLADEITIDHAGATTTVIKNGFPTDYADSDLLSLSIQPYGGNDVVRINHNPNVPMSVYAGDGDDQIHLADGYFYGLSNLIDVHGQDGNDTVYVHDQSSIGDTRPYEVGSNLFSRQGDVTIASFDAVENVDVDANAEGTDFQVDIVDPGVHVSITDHGGSDTLRVGSVLGSMDEVQGTVHFNGGPLDHAVLDDRQGAAGQNYVNSTAGSVAILGRGSARIEVSGTPQIGLVTTAFDDTIDVSSTPADVAWSIDDTGGSDELDLTPSIFLPGPAVIGGRLETIQGPIAFGGNGGDTVVLDDRRGYDGRTYRFEPGDNDDYELDYGGPELLYYQYVDKITVRAGNDDDQFVARESGTALHLDGGDGSHYYQFTPDGNGPVFVTGSGMDLIEFDGSLPPDTFYDPFGYAYDTVVDGAGLETGRFYKFIEGSDPYSDPISYRNVEALLYNGGTATNYHHVFSTLPETLTFVPGQLERWIVVPIIGDTELEGDETFTASLANLSFGQFADDTATVTITNDDSLLIAEANGPYNVIEGDSVALSSAGSDDSDGVIVEFAWDLDYDGVSFGADAFGPSPDFSAVGLNGPTTRTVALRVTDDVGNTSLDTATVKVGNVAPVVDAGPDDTIGQATDFTSMGSFADPGPDAWTATVDYGDGTGPQSLLVNPDKTFSLSHSYSAHGSYLVTVTVDDGDDVGSDTATVNVLNELPQVDAGGPYTVDEGGTVIISGASASDIDGSIVSHEWDLDYDGVTFDANAFAPAPTYSAAGLDGPGARTVALRVTDNDGASAFDTATVNIINASHTVSAGPDAAIATGATFSASGSFVDPGPDNWTATVDYGEGEGLAPLALNPDKTFDLSHAFASPGTYLVTVTVDDGDGGIASDSLNVTVVAPPTVESVVFGDGSAQRSMVTSITVTFSTIMDLDPGVFELDQIGFGAVAYQVDTSVFDGKTVAVLRFEGPTTIAGSLPDGDYLLTIRSDRAYDTLRQQLDGDADGISGGNAIKEFFRLFGDSDGDGDVDKEDRSLFNQTLGSVSGDPDYLDFFDFDRDGHVDQRDRKEFNKRFNNK